MVGWRRSRWRRLGIDGRKLPSVKMNVVIVPDKNPRLTVDGPSLEAILDACFRSATIFQAWATCRQGTRFGVGKLRSALFR